MWRDLRSVFACLSASPHCRVIILTGAGKGFTSGLDIHDHIDLFAQNSQAGSDAARQALAKLPLITAYQDSISSLERARVPVIAAIHGACVGGGVDLICAADIRCVACISVSGAPLLCLSLPPCRLASSDAWFSIMETRLGLAADVGTLQAPAPPPAAMWCLQRTATPHVPCSACPASSATPLLHVNGRSRRAGSQLMRCIAHTALAHLLASFPFLQALQAGLLSRYTCIYMLSLAVPYPLPAACTTPMQTFRQPPSLSPRPSCCTAAVTAGRRRAHSLSRRKLLGTALWQLQEPKPI